MPPKFTVAICTWNRSQLLAQTLHHLTQIECDEPWEVVLVDNNSSDETPEVADSYKCELDLRYVKEEKQGHSHARNKAIMEARGEWIA